MRRWFLLAAAALGVIVTALLGRWQLHRADEKLALQAALAAQADLPALTAAELGASVQAGPAVHTGRRVQLRGRWLAMHTVYLDNRPMDGRAGFYVVTPLRLDTGLTVLVQRGWLPRNAADRTRLPDFATPAGEIEVRGRLLPQLSQAYDLGASGQGPIRQNLDPAAFGVERGVALLPYAVLQTEGSADGLLRQWPAPDVGLQKHYGYAFQWFALSALILGLYVWFQLVRPRLRPSA